MIDPMMHLAELVKDDEKKSQSYSAWVDWVIENIDKWASAWNGYGDTPYADLDKVASGEMGIDEIQHYVHAHTFQMNFLGFLKKYQETGNASYLEKVVGAWEDITSRQRYITGTVSVGEHYEAGHNLPNTGSVGETCATNSWTMLNNNLFEFTEDAKYQQTVEDVIFNHMFATSTIDGDGYSYHRPLNGTTERFYTGPDCCSSSGMRIQSYVPYYIYLKSDSAVYINQFISSEVKIDRDNGVMHLKQTTDYPTSDVVQLKVMEDSVGGMLKVRIPDWVENPTMQLNGKKVDTPITAGSYVSLSVSAGDELTITYPSEPVWVEGDNSNKGLWAIKEGPMVYCANAAFMSKEESQIAFGTDIAKVFASSVLKPENGKSVEMTEAVTYDDARIFGNGYKVKMNTLLGEQDVTIVPYANIGQWYRYGDTKPANYNTTERYPYAIWMSGILTDYPQEPDPETKPVVHYDFDTTEGTTVKDISGNGKDAILLDGAVTKLNGRLGSSVNLNGTSAYVQLPEDVLYGLYDLSIAVWIKPNELGSWARIFDFGSKQSPPYPNLFATVNSGNNNLRLAYEDGENARADAGAVLKTGTWQHLAISIDGTKALLYLNGIKVAENSSFHFSPIMTTNMINNYIGKSNYVSDRYFSGEIDDFRIYNRALSAKEFVALSKGEEPIKNVQTFVQPENVKTIAGIAPVLPQKINVTYDDGTNGKENVVWEEISADKYAVEGSFEVKGTIGNQTILLVVIVEKSLINDSENLEPDTNINNSTNNNTNNNNTNNNNTNNDTTNNTTVVLNSETVMKDNPGLPSGTNEEARNSTFKDLTAHAAKVTKTSIQLKWKRIADAQGYIVFGNLCNNGGKKYKFEMLRIIENNTQTKYTHTKLKKGKFYKYMVQAYTIVEGKLQILATSKTIHVTTKGGKKNNVSNLKLKTPKIHLKSGERIKLKVTEVMKGKNKKSHKKLAFESGNKSIATVNAKGILKAKKKGTCDIYIYAHNGIYKKVKVQVK